MDKYKFAIRKDGAGFRAIMCDSSTFQYVDDGVFLRQSEERAIRDAITWAREEFCPSEVERLKKKLNWQTWWKTQRSH